MDFTKLEEKLNEAGSQTERVHNFSVVKDEVEDNLYEIKLANLEEFKVFLSKNTDDISALVLLFSKDSILAERKEEFHEYLLETNALLPYSSFCILDDSYLLKASIPVNSNLNDVISLIEQITITLIANAENLQEFIVQ